MPLLRSLVAVGSDPYLQQYIAHIYTVTKAIRDLTGDWIALDSLSDGTTQYMAVFQAIQAWCAC